MTPVELLAQDWQVEDGVVVPLELAPQVRRLVLEALAVRDARDGGVVRTRRLTALLLALDVGSRRHLEGLVLEDPAGMSARGQAGGGSASVVSVQVVGERSGCGVRQARRLAAGPLGGHKVGRDWVVDEAILEKYLRERA